MLIRPDASRRALIRDPLGFRNFLRDLYTHRRKNLRGALAGLPGRPFPKEEVDRKLAELAFDGSLRAETLDPQHHLRLSTVFG